MHGSDRSPGTAPTCRSCAGAPCLLPANRSGLPDAAPLIPSVSFKGVRLGLTRFQWCPVGKHFSIVRPVNESELTDEQ